MAARRSSLNPQIPYTRDELYGMDLPVYCGESLKEVSFPLGGIGTGTIGLGGRGELRDWEIFNDPNLGYRPPYTMPYIFCKQGARRVAKVLERALLPPFHQSGGLPPNQFTGLPRLDEAVFVGTYPVARILFQDEDLPVNVQLEAFSPMIPGQVDDSAIPAAVLIYRVVNRAKERVSGSIAMSITNEVGRSAIDGKLGGNVNAFRDAGGVRGIYMTSGKHEKDQVGYGTQGLLTTARKVTYATDFDEPGWFDRGQKVWDEYSTTGRLSGPTGRTAPGKGGRSVIGMLAVPYSLKPGEATEIAFLITWSFPYRPVRWGWVQAEKPPAIRNHYARKFPDAWKVGRYLASNFERLRTQTLRFEQALFDSTLPGVVLDAVSSQMSIIRTNTTMWLDASDDEKGGRIFAFEGCNPNTGCCPMNCTHVWNYEQSLGHLYPSLERTMRRTDYENNVNRDGAMRFRTTLPLGRRASYRHASLPAADGQFGTVVRMHREWRISGDDEMLRRYWGAVKKTIRFAWTGSAAWDADKDGVLEGVQHNTYDIEFHGPNTMCGSLYLAALLAGAEMADAVGDAKAAREFREVYRSGRREYDKLFNGEYYVQKVREVTKDQRLTDIFRRPVPPGRPKYQYGAGCLTDQLLGQWAGHVEGMGYVLPEDHVRTALAEVFANNFKPSLSDHESCQRTYALGDEAGVVLCTWPRGRREAFPFPYSDEVWTGIEYQLAAHLIYEGMIDEGLAVVAGVRERHDGVSRNPWNEFECGDHYARAMSSWSLLLALSGQRYDGRTETLTFRPVIQPADFRCLYTANDAYGTVDQKFKDDKLTLRVDCLSGRVRLKALDLTWGRARLPRRITGRARCGGKPIGVSVKTDGRALHVTLSEKVSLGCDDVLTVSLRGAPAPKR